MSETNKLIIGKHGARYRKCPNPECDSIIYVPFYRSDEWALNSRDRCGKCNPRKKAKPKLKMSEMARRYGILRVLIQQGKEAELIIQMKEWEDGQNSNSE